MLYSEIISDPVAISGLIEEGNPERTLPTRREVDLLKEELVGIEPRRNCLAGAGFGSLSEEWAAVFQQGPSGYFDVELLDLGWRKWDAAHLLAHLGRDYLHISPDRNFSRAYYLRLCPECRRATVGTEDGLHKLATCTVESCGYFPRLKEVDRIGDAQYIVLRNQARAGGGLYYPVIVVDMDSPTRPGGSVNALECLHELNALNSHGYGPNWLGINPISGKGQAIWYIDPVYSDGTPSRPGHRNTHLELYKHLCKDIDRYLAGDTHFSRRFSRNPLYTGNDPEAYQWNAYHHEVYNMRDLQREVRGLLGEPYRGRKPRKKNPLSGKEIITRAKASTARRKAEAEAARAAKPAALMSEMDLADCNLTGGVELYWEPSGKLDRNVTAFRHAFKIARRLYEQGDPVTEKVILKNWDHAYSIALSQDPQQRLPDPMSDRERQGLAARIKKYVTQGRTISAESISDIMTYTGTDGQKTPRETILQTWGRKGGQKSAAKKWADHDSPEAQEALKGLDEGRKQSKKTRKAAASTTRARVMTLIAEAREAGEEPNTAHMAAQVGVTVRYIQRIRKQLGEAAPQHTHQT